MKARSSRSRSAPSASAPAESSRDDSLCAYIGGMVAQRLHRMLSHTEGVGHREVEAVHQMRVWSRRTRAALLVAESCVRGRYRGEFERLAREVKTVTRALGAARDLDVMILSVQERAKSLPLNEHGGVESFIASLRDGRDARQEDLDRAITHLEKQHLCRRWTDLSGISDNDVASQNGVTEDGPEADAHATPPKSKSRLRSNETTREHGEHAILAQWEAVRVYEPVLEQPERVTELHEMRIVAKHFRYTLEIFKDAYPGKAETKAFTQAIEAVKALQEHLGQIHDADVLVPLLTRHLDRTLRPGYGKAKSGEPKVGTHLVNWDDGQGLMTLCLQLRDERATRYVQLGMEWRSYQESGVWERLRAVVEGIESEKEASENVLVSEGSKPADSSSSQETSVSAPDAPLPPSSVVQEAVPPVVTDGAQPVSSQTAETAPEDALPSGDSAGQNDATSASTEATAPISQDMPDDAQSEPQPKRTRPASPVLSGKTLRERKRRLG